MIRLISSCLRFLNPRKTHGSIHASQVPLTLAAIGLLLITTGCLPKQEKVTLLQPGDTAPVMTLRDQNGQSRDISALEGVPMLIYFYPKDGTPGCTKEACTIRDAWDAYEQAGIRVVGVSTDSVQSHAKFAKKNNLPFILLSDPDGQLGRAFGVVQRLGVYERVSFLIDKTGTIRKVYPDVKPSEHADQVLRDAKSLGLTTDNAAAAEHKNETTPTAGDDAPNGAAPRGDDTAPSDAAPPNAHNTPQPTNDTSTSPDETVEKSDRNAAPSDENADAPSSPKTP